MRIVRSDLVDRHFVATRPNQLWVSDFVNLRRDVAGLSVYVAFVIDVFARLHQCRLARVDFAPHGLRPRWRLSRPSTIVCGDGAGDLNPLHAQRPRHEAG